MNTYIDMLYQQLYSSIEAKKDNLIRQKLIEKGFEKIAIRLGVERFPKLARIINDNWEYYYADDGTEDGAFIVAIKKYEIVNEIENNKITITFQWQDTVPLHKL